MAQRLNHFLAKFSSRLQPIRGQSFVEFALVLPVIILLMLGLVEVTVFIGRYLDVLDLTREASRFASLRDPFDSLVASDENCSTPEKFNFYYDTACIFSPPANSGCPNSNFCNGMNPYVYIDPARDDVVISIYTVSNNHVTNVWPKTTKYWNLSGTSQNWKKDCDGNLLNPAPSSPYYTESLVNSMLMSGSQPMKGFVAVEVYYCHEQVLNIPILSQLIDNPMRIHAYTIMPLPEAQPTATTTVLP